jgi:hypothetical protein
MRMFPRFGEGEQMVSDPGEFAALPMVRSFSPNFLSVHCSPFADIDAELEYWVPESHAVAGRICLEKARVARSAVKLSRKLNPTEGKHGTAEMHTAPLPGQPWVSTSGVLTGERRVSSHTRR